METIGLRRLALRDRHVRAGSRFAPFAGWEMPLQYTGIVSEHEAVRRHAGVFDVSHLARVWLTGPAAGPALRSITTYNVLRVPSGAAHYSLYCNDAGGIGDDIFVYHVGPERWLVVHNAARAADDLSRLRAVGGPAAEDVTDSTVMLAVQGPDALGVLDRLIGPAIGKLAKHQCGELAWRGERVLVARTGYTGEDGAELAASPDTASKLWDELLAAGVTPAGLGARDSLRLEAALPLYGNDIDDSTNPYEAGLGWAVSLNDGANFTGRTALAAARSIPPARRLTLLRANQRAVLRRGYLVFDGESEVSTLTSGAFSPMLATGIGMAYLPSALAVPGSRLAVDIRGRRVPVTVVERPFYRGSGS